ncbi:Snf7-domain-containing protein [Dendrothele bispora CBS 962.96]|uniref:Snf7-domain-containing protein n=1 Tax=Dendrothele bispora (strain CBS 962.96) TaxID=1314807 RepID=A0A4S8M2J4_DENBC|nr:Snf7-domain-containing protein [Dendrothele bispora CBS 962.96]
MSIPTTPINSPYKKTSTLVSVPAYVNASPSRLQSLYSDFSRKKQSDPASYQANIEWWRKSLENYVYDGHQRSHRLVLQAEKTLVDNYRIERVGKPIGLGAVVAELVTPPSPSSLPVLFPVATFLSLPNSIYSSKSKPSYLAAVPKFVLSYVVAKPLWWALEQVGVVGEDSLASSISSVFSSSSTSKSDTTWYGDYVFLDLLERAGENVLEKQAVKATTASDALYTFEGFRQEFSDCFGSTDGATNSMMSELDMKVLLEYLERDKEAIVVDAGIVKFLGTVGLMERDSEITAVDRGILELKTAVEGLHTQVDGIHKRIEQRTSEASEALRQKRKGLAMSYLRSRKQLEDLLTKRLGALDNLEGTLIRVEAAAGDVEILKSYSTSTTTLRAILSHPSLQRDSIEKTMEAMAEATADAKEIDQAMRIGGDVALGVDDVVDDTEIEAELAGLIRDAEQHAKGQQEEKELKDLRTRMEELNAPSNMETSQPRPESTREAVAAQ